MKKLLLTFLIAFITALGLNAAVESPYKHTFEKEQLTMDAGSKTLSGVSWSWTKMTFLGFTNNAVQIGSSKKPQTSDWTISTTGISGTITSVKVNAWTGESATLKVSVGETAFACGKNTTQNLTSTASYYEFTGSASGEIKITMKAGSKAMYLQSIEVTFSTGGGSTETIVLGEIKMGSTLVSTDKTKPTATYVKGGGEISFISANAASMNVYTLSDNVLAASSGEGSVTWTAPAATDEEQVIDLKVVSQLQNEGEELQKKEAFVTVTVPVKSNVSDDFTLITDAGDLYDGMEMYIVSGTIALSTTQNDNNRGQTDVTIENGILTPTSSAQLITLEATNVTEKPWKFNVGDGYLYAASSSKNYLRTSASPSNDNEKATISIETNGNATITFQGTSERNVLEYNSNSKLFSCYTGGQTEVQIYAKKTMTAVAPGEVTSMPAAVEGVITINKDEEITFSSKDAAKLQVSTQSEPVVGSSYKYTPTEEGVVTITPIDSEGKVYTEKAATFTIKFFKGLVDGTISYNTNTFTYTIGSEATLPELVKEPADVDVEYSISHNVAVYHPATIDEQGNITVNTPGIVTVTATVKADRAKTASYVLEIQSRKEAEIASTVKAPVVHITGGNVYYSLDGEWYWGTEDESDELSFANETEDAQIYYTMTSATPSSANVRAMANSETGTLYSTPFKKSDLDGKKITFWAEKDGQKSAVETLNFNIKTGIEDIDVENAEAIEEEGDARYFNLQGLEVKNPGEGIYIRVANGKATKILKK